MLGADLLPERSRGFPFLLVRELVELGISILEIQVAAVKIPVSSDPPGEVHVLPHEGDSIGMDGADVRVFEDSDQVGFTGFLESNQCSGLELEGAVDVVGN